MAEILAFRSSTPVVHIDGTGEHGYFVNVRPCPDGIPSLLHFATGDEAFECAAALQREHGWRVDIACQLSGFDGAA